MKYVKVICNYCGNNVNKPNNEYNRKIRLNTPMFCNSSCATSFNNSKKDYSKMNKNFKNYKPISNPFKYYIKLCKQRKYENTMNIEYLENLWIKQNGICPYTKIKLILNSHSRNKIKKDIRYLASLDRIDSSKGYIEGNVQFISAAINFMKNSMSHSDTIEFLQIIKNNS